MSQKVEDRNKSFQKTPELEQIKSYRNTLAVDLRKKKRNSIIQKKRGISLSQDSSFEVSSHALESKNLNPETVLLKIRTCTEISELESLLRSLKYLSINFPDHYLSEYFDDTLIQQFFKILTSNVVCVQNLALWVLINEFHKSGASINKFVSAGILDILTLILKHVTCPDIIEHTLWALANIVSEDIQYRNIVSTLSILDEVIELSQNSDCSIQRNAFWVLFSITCYRPPLAYHVGLKILNTVEVGFRSDDSETIEHCAWITFYLLEAYDQLIQVVLNSEIIVLIYSLLGKTEVELLKPLLKTVGVVSSGTDLQTKIIVEVGFLNKLFLLLEHPVSQVRAQVLFILANILGSTEDLILKVLRSPWLAKILDSIENPDFNIKKNSLICLCNPTYTRSLPILKILTQSQTLSKLLQSLQTNHEFFISESLKALKNLLTLSKTHQSPEIHKNFLDNIYDLGGYDSLQDLTTSSNTKINAEASIILNTFFDIPSANLIQPVEVFSFN